MPTSPSGRVAAPGKPHRGHPRRRLRWARAHAQPAVIGADGGQPGCCRRSPRPLRRRSSGVRRGKPGVRAVAAGSRRPRIRWHPPPPRVSPGSCCNPCMTMHTVANSFPGRADGESHYPTPNCAILRLLAAKNQPRSTAPTRSAAHPTAASRAALASSSVSVRSDARKRSANVSDLRFSPTCGPV